MNIFVAIERIAELNYFANSDKVIQIISEGNYYLIKCKRGKKKKESETQAWKDSPGSLCPLRHK